MFQRYVLGSKIMAISFLTALLSACTDGAVEVPGDVPNPKLAEMINISLDEEIRRMNPTWAPGLIPQAAASARLWLKEINEVVSHCKYGPRNSSKFNLLEYDVALNSGDVVKDVFTGQRCIYDVSLPLVMRVRFVEGKVIEVFTDGRERGAPVDAALSETNQFAESVIRVDWSRNRARYFPASKTEAQISDEWKLKKP